MKLFTRYTRVNLLATVIVFLMAGTAFYFLLRLVLIDQVDDDLKIEQREIETYVKKYDRLPEIIPVKDQHISYAAADKGDKKSYATIKSKDDGDVFRQLKFYTKANNLWYEVKVSKSLEGTDDMAQSIITITLSTILLMLAISLLINRIVLRKLWKPFYDTMETMRRFELGKKQAPGFPETAIDEFNVMNNTLKEVTTKAERDYLLLKEFTENASHELQTPLAIIQSKLDLLIQDEHLSEQQGQAVQGAYEAIQKLSRLNQSLLLLSKIENGQYADLSSINLSQKINEKLEQFEEMIQSKDIVVHKQAEEDVFISMNPMLADILLNNLFSNAIRYNPSGGHIGLIVKKGSFEMNNPGNNGLEPSRLFRRFGKTGQVKDGTGLGLAIIKQVADISGLKTNYLYLEQHHRFLFTW